MLKVNFYRSDNIINNLLVEKKKRQRAVEEDMEIQYKSILPVLPLSDF